MIDHLEQHQGRWRVRIWVPEKARAAFQGVINLLWETGCSERARARRLAAPTIKRYKQQIALALGKPRGRIHLKHSRDATYTDEWWTNPRVFQAMPGVVYDIDVASPGADLVPWVPALHHFTKEDDGLAQDWGGRFVWMNCPFGLKHGNMAAWLAKFVENGNGVCMVASNTYTGWWQQMASSCDAVLHIKGYVNGVNPAKHGSKASFGCCLFAIGERGVEALRLAEAKGLGHLVITRPDVR
jgi:hypothetical protein